MFILKYLYPLLYDENFLFLFNMCVVLTVLYLYVHSVICLLYERIISLSLLYMFYDREARL